MDFKTDIFNQFDQGWALVTAGTTADFNTMTISWGSLGTLWNRPVATVYVRKSRYTHEFMEENDYFTVSFFPEEYKKTLAVLGSKSGRDMDKINASGLTPIPAGPSTTFAEAEVTLLCRKLFTQPLAAENIPQEVIEEDYPNGDFHDMYIGEVIQFL